MEAVFESILELGRYTTMEIVHQTPMDMEVERSTYFYGSWKRGRLS